MATTLTRWDPVNEFAGLRGAMDRLFEQSFGRLPSVRNGGEDLGIATLSIDVVENGNEYVVKAAVPGVEPKDVEISIDDDVLTITGSFEKAEDHKDDQYLRREIRWGSFQRSLRLPPEVEPDKANCNFENGMLKLTLPKRPEARARSLKITPQGVIEGESRTAEKGDGGQHTGEAQPVNPSPEPQGEHA